MPQLSRTEETERHILPTTRGTDDEAWVDLKKRVRHGDVSTARKAVVKVSAADMAMMAGPGGGDQRVVADVMARGIDPAAYPDALMAQMIVAWNFTEPDGNPIPITMETVALLEEEDADFLWSIVQEKSRGRHPLENGTSGKRSPHSSLGVAEPLPMPKPNRR